MSTMAQKTRKRPSASVRRSAVPQSAEVQIAESPEVFLWRKVAPALRDFRFTWTKTPEVTACPPYVLVDAAVAQRLLDAAIDAGRYERYRARLAEDLVSEQLRPRGRRKHG